MVPIEAPWYGEAYSAIRIVLSQIVKKLELKKFGFWSKIIKIWKRTFFEIQFWLTYDVMSWNLLWFTDKKSYCLSHETTMIFKMSITIDTFIFKIEEKKSLVSTDLPW